MIKKDIKKMISVEIKEELHEELKKAVELDGFTIRQIIEYGLKLALDHLENHRNNLKKIEKL